MIFGGIAAGLIGLFLFTLIRQEAGIRPPALRILPTDPVRGSAGAPVTILSFGDFQCDFCKDQEAVFTRLLTDYPDRVRVVWKDLPLIDLHNQALPAAIAARCAQEQGKFWEYHDALYANQEQLAAERYTAIVSDLALDGGAFAECTNTDKPLSTIEENRREAAKRGINTTPYFFVNGTAFDRLTSFEELSTLINGSLTK